MSNWEGFDADKMDLKKRQMSVRAVQRFYELFWKEHEIIDEMIDLLEQKNKSPF